MSARPRDHEARTLAALDHAADRAVEAGAGTGKTTLLVDRIVEGLRTGAFEMSGLVAITFTRKAAGELRERLRDRLTKAASELPLARVSTIHSFCARLLRQHPLEAGLDPDFEVSAETRQRELFDDAWTRWLHERELRSDDPVAEALAWGAGVEVLRTVAFALVAEPDVEPPPLLAAPDDDTIWSTFRDRGKAIRDRLELNLKGGKRDKFADAMDQFVAAADGAEQLPPELRVRFITRRVSKRTLSGERRLAFAPDDCKSRGVKTNYSDQDELAAIREEFDAWRTDGIVPLLKARFGALATRVAHELAKFRDSARESRLARGMLSQTDLLHEALRLLRDRENGVLDRVCRRTSALMVDEYQDTDPIQASIVSLVREHKAAPTLFLVGDPKQSIYRFRRADVQTYMEEVGRLEAAGRLGRIVVNFRSRQPLIDAINRIGRECFAARPGVVQAEWEDLEPYEETPGGRTGASLEIVSCPVDEERSNTADLAFAEARSLAARLVAAHGDGYAWRDMSILFATSGRLSILEDELDRAGIPFRQEKSQDFFRRIEIAEISWLATAIADPWDEHAGAALLRSRLFGIDDGALLAHRAAGGRFAAAAPGEGGLEAVRTALAAVAAWHERSREESPPALLESAIRQRGLMLLLASLPHGSRDAANVRKLLDQASAWWAGGGLGMADFARWLRSQVASTGVREPESPSAEEEDRVALLTIHAAKGLEWPVVGLYDVHGASGGRGAPATVLDRATGASRHLAVRLAELLVTPGYDEARARDDDLEDAERVRLLYVAVTRARERLVIAAPEHELDGRSDSAMLAILRRSATWRDWENAAREGCDPAAPHVTAPAASTVPAAAPASRPTLDAKARGAAQSRRAAWRDERRRVLERADGLVVTVPSDLHAPAEEAATGAGDPDGRRIGRAVHLALEWLAGGLIPDVDVAVRRALRADSEELAQRVQEYAGKALASGTWARLAEADSVLAEMPIAWRARFEDLPAACGTILEGRLAEDGRPAPRPDTPVLVEGFVDLVLVEGSRLTVVDYKTDRYERAGQEKDLLRRYAPQLEAYRAALRVLPGVNEVRCLLLLLGGPGEAREITLPAAE